MSGSNMHAHRANDTPVIELLRVESALEIGDLAAALGVTATAIRQRLDRLMRAGLVERKTVSRPRGRPAHAYSLTAEGRRSGGDNFRDLALVLWREIRGVRDPAVRQGLLSRIGSAMAKLYGAEVSGDNPAARLHSLADLMRRKDIACDVAVGPGDLAVLTSYSCPYPELAEQDRSICAAERLMLQDLVGTSVALSECRLDGSTCCRFTAGPAGEPGQSAADGPEGLENKAVTSSNAGRFSH